MASSRIRSAGGFTLLELMISLALLGVMLAMTYSVFATALSSVPFGEDLASRSARLRAATSLLTRQIRSIVAYPSEGEEDSTPCYFQGFKDRFDFITAAPQSRGGEGLGWVTYWTDGHSLWMAERLIISSSTIRDQATGEAQQTEDHEVQLLDGFQQVVFRYQRVDGIDEVENLDEWDPFEEQALPSAILVELHGQGREDSLFFQIPIMMVAYGLGGYDCEAGFANRDRGEGALDAGEGGNAPGIDTPPQLLDFEP